MTTLTPDQIAYYRQLANDQDGANLVVSDTQIQAFYDKAVASGADDDTVEAMVMVKMYRLLMADARKKIDVGGEVENETRSQLFKHIRDDLLPSWEGLAGIGGAGVMGTGVLNLNLEYTEDDLANEDF